MSGPIVRVEGVHKTFGRRRGDQVVALADVSLAFEPGIIYGLLGPNGAGKTTLIRVLATLLRPDSGVVEVAGIDVLSNPAAVRGKIGLAGQYAALDSYLTGRENVEMVGQLYGLPTAEVRRRTDDVLERIGLTDAASRPVRTYSGGMRRRLDLAASLVGRPDVLFLDEPTTGIDPRSRLDLWALIHDLVEAGTTVLLTTQYLEEADRLADRIAVIDDGRLITEGTAAQLKETLGGAVIELTVSEDARDDTIAALARVCDQPATFDAESGHITVPAPDGAQTLLETVRLLDSSGIRPEDIALRKPTLDEVFLSLTGHAPAETKPGETPRRGRRRERASR